VHVIPTITKKNRPGYVLLLDVEPAAEESMGSFLARELGVSGYHKLDTEHSYMHVSFVTTTIEFCHEGRVIRQDCLLKLIGPADKPLHVKVEYEELLNVRKMVEREFGLDMVLDDLKKQIERGFSGDSIRIEV